ALTWSWSTSRTCGGSPSRRTFPAPGMNVPTGNVRHATAWKHCARCPRCSIHCERSIGCGAGGKSKSERTTRDQGLMDKGATTTSHVSPSEAATRVRHDVSLLSEQDLHLFNEGTHYQLHQKLGAHLMTVDGVRGAYFAVWAPNARQVSVIGDFSSWDRRSHALRPRGQSGIWEGFIPGVAAGACYKYYIISHSDDYRVEKADPFAFWSEIPPKTASVVYELDYFWGDEEWMGRRRERNS